MNDAHLAEVERLTALLVAAEARAAEAKGVRDAAVRAAISAGVPTRTIAEVAGLSQARVYQIRDGRR